MRCVHLSSYIHLSTQAHEPDCYKLHLQSAGKYGKLKGLHRFKIKSLKKFTYKYVNKILKLKNRLYCRETWYMKHSFSWTTKWGWAVWNVWFWKIINWFENWKHLKICQNQLNHTTICIFRFSNSYNFTRTNSFRFVKKSYAFYEVANS